MIFSFIAGFLNALGTIFLKLSSKSYLYIFFSILFYGLNFYFFRISLQELKPSNAYCLFIISTLFLLKVFEIFSLRQLFGIGELLGIICFLIAVYLLR